MNRRFNPEFPRGMDEKTSRAVRKAEEDRERAKRRRELSEDPALPLIGVPAVILCVACQGRGCGECRGQGVLPEETGECPRCYGVGALGRLDGSQLDCPACNGSGRVRKGT